MFKKFLVLASLVSFMCANAYGGTVTIMNTASDTGLPARTVWGNKRVVLGTVVLIGAYSGTAFTFTPTTVGLNKIEKVIFYPVGASDAYYTPYISGDYIYLRHEATNAYKSSITAPAASDTFNVYTKALAAADAETCLVLVKPVFGQLAKLVAPGVGPAEINDAMLHRAWTYADSTSYAGAVDDSVGNVSEIGGGYKGGDTLYWDYNATNRSSRLYYTGNVMGNQGTLYVPTGGGHFLKVIRYPSGGTANSVVRLGAYPLYFKPSAGLDDKFQCDITGTTTATTGGLVDTTYTSLVQYETNASSDAWAGESISATYDFIVIGN